MDVVTKIYEELAPLLMPGVWVSIICTVIFMIFKLPSKWSSDKKKLLMHIIVLIVSFFWAWLIVDKIDSSLKIVAQDWAKVAAFAFLFYELVGQWIIKKIFKTYRINAEKKLGEFIK